MNNTFFTVQIPRCAGPVRSAIIGHELFLREQLKGLLMKKYFAAILIAFSMLPACVSAAVKLDVGVPAPTLKPLKWIKGQPVNKFEAGKIYVINFWATWCAPFKTSIPEIAVLARQYTGKVVFAGVDVQDLIGVASQEEYVQKISQFVNEMGDKMDYSIALDDVNGTLNNTWILASDAKGIPATFIIGKDGKIAAICHPNELGTVLPQVVAGKFDPKAYAAEKAKQLADEKKFEDAFNGVTDLCTKGKFKEAAAEMDKVLAANPDYESRVALFKFDILRRTDGPGAYAYAIKAASGVIKNDSSALAAIAATIIGPGIKSPDLDTALMLAEKAAQLTNRTDPAIMDTLGSIYFRKNNLDKAIEAQEIAVKNIESDLNMPDRFKQPILDHLAEYKKKKEGK